MKTNRWFFLLLVPVLWSVTSLIHFQFPGDEYAMWGISSLAGSWVLSSTPNVGDINQAWIRFSVAGLGFLVMAVVGWVLCWLKVRIRTWSALWLACAIAWLAFMIGKFPSTERALAKNGSWSAYVLSAMLMAAYATTLLAILGGGVKLLMRKFQKPSALNAGPNPAVTAR